MDTEDKKIWDTKPCFCVTQLKCDIALWYALSKYVELLQIAWPPAGKWRKMFHQANGLPIVHKHLTHRKRQIRYVSSRIGCIALTLRDPLERGSKLRFRCPICEWYCPNCRKPQADHDIASKRFHDDGLLRCAHTHKCQWPIPRVICKRLMIKTISYY